MTLLDIRNQIINSLCHQDTFSVADFTGISVNKDLEENKSQLILTVLEELCKIEILQKVSDSFWILKSPLNSSGQDLHLTMSVANAVSETIEAYLNANDIPHDPIDSLNIREGHIVNLLEIIGDLINTDVNPKDQEDHRN